MTVARYPPQREKVGERQGEVGEREAGGSPPKKVQPVRLKGLLRPHVKTRNQQVIKNLTAMM